MWQWPLYWTEQKWKETRIHLQGLSQEMKAMTLERTCLCAWEIPNHMGKGCNGRFSTRGCSRHQRTLPTGSHSEGAEKLLLVKRKLGFLPFSSVQLLSPVRFFATLCTAASQATLSITNSRSLLKLMSIESVMPSNHLILCHSLLFLPLNLSQQQGLFQWVSSSHQVAKVLEFQL